jgi:16S rRNA (guanine1516-N2)-methyltransferase
MKSIAVVCESTSYLAKAKEISALVDAPFFLGVPLGNFDFVLAVTGERVELRRRLDDPNPIAVDFSKGAVGYRLRTKSQSRDLLLRAIGSGRKKILDLTAGWATDSFILAGHGFEVTAIEQSPVLGTLVKDALERGIQDANLSKICGRIDFRIGESRDFLSAQKGGEWDAVYMDPMFPEKKKSSLPKKELQVLQELVGVGDETESQSLLAAAGKHSCRVVVKRPMSAPPLLPGMSSSIKGRSVRFDIYIFS